MTILLYTMFIILMINYLAWGMLIVFGKIWSEIKGITRPLIKIGVYFHEIMHYLILKILWVHVRFQDIHIDSDSGFVHFTRTTHDSFIKLFIAAMAPWIGAALVIPALYQFDSVVIWAFTLSGPTWNWIRIILVASIILEAPPSIGDWKLVYNIAATRFGVFVKHLGLAIGSYLLYTSPFMVQYQIQTSIYALWAVKAADHVSISAMAALHTLYFSLIHFVIAFLVGWTIDTCLFGVKYIARKISATKRVENKFNESHREISNALLKRVYQECYTNPHQLVGEDVARTYTQANSAYVTDADRQQAEFEAAWAIHGDTPPLTGSQTHETK